jgi:hypothetical protein
MSASLNEGEARDRADVIARLRTAGFARLSAGALATTARVDLERLDALKDSWNALPADTYLRDGGRYRFRRHSCFVQSLAPPELSPVPHRAHWQPTTYNALHGGIERWFEPIEPHVQGASVWCHLLQSLGSLFFELTVDRPAGAQLDAPPESPVGRPTPVERWYVEAHQFRIDATNGIGRPTPEGAHRDGVDFVAVILVERRNVRGGETHVFDANGPAGTRFSMQQPWTALLMDDARVIHETTPIQPTGEPAFRDTLVLTYRAGGFQARPI